MMHMLRDTLKLVRSRAGVRFSGIGLLACDAPEGIPIFPIRLPDRPPIGYDLIDYLAAISNTENEYHDGFHIVSSDFRLLRTAQYFSPPIVFDVEVDRTRRFGARYLAALFGSSLPEVKIAGVASSDFGIAVFEHGSEVLFERNL